MNKSNTNEAFEALKVYLVNNYRAKVASGGREIIKRCHICGDSRDKSNAHMYIGLRDGVIVYNCFKCNSKGIVDGEFLRNMGCYEPELASICNEQNKSSSKSSSYKKSLFKYSVPLIPFSNDEIAMRKLNYLSKRLGINFDSQLAVKLKIVLNLKDFIKFNNFDFITRKPEVIDILNDCFIGFLSVDNRYVILRRIIKEGILPEYIDHRYVDYDILGGNISGYKYYFIPSFARLDMPIDIHIAEGAFDILSIYLNLPHQNNNSIYASIGGKSYSSLARFFISRYGLTNFNLHIYLDADVNNNQVERIRNELALFNVNIFIHRNMSPGEKDFGVSVDRIKDSVLKL